MIENKRIEWNKILLAALIATLLFVLGLLLGYLYSINTRTNTEVLTQSIYNDLIETQIQKDLLNQYPCSNERLSILTNKLGNVGSTLDVLEKRLGFSNKEVLNIKRLYILLQLNHYLLEKQRNSECGSNNTFIFFFYSNADQSQKGTDVANILQYTRANYPNTRVYSFDDQIKLDIIETMKEQYNITAFPGVVINGEKIGRINSINDLTPYLD